MGMLSLHLASDDILLDFPATNKTSLFTAIGQHVAKTHPISGAAVTAALERRELAAPTSLGGGVAIPHARVPGLDAIRALYVRLAKPMPSYASGQPVSDIVALLVPAPAIQEHLDVLADVASLFFQDDFKANLRACQQRSEVLQLFEHWPR